MKPYLIWPFEFCVTLNLPKKKLRILCSFLQLTSIPHLIDIKLLIILLTADLFSVVICPFWVSMKNCPYFISNCALCVFFFFFFQYIKCYPQCPAIHLFFMRLLHNNNQSNVLYFIFPRSKIIVCWFITHYEGSAICKTLLANGQNCPLVCSSKENLAQLFPLLWCFWRKRLKYVFFQKIVVILCWNDTF
jgi:hypothetical protein